MSFNVFILFFLIFSISGEASEDLRITVKDKWMVDTHGRVRIFHGFNNVRKSFPWYDVQILNETRAELYKQWGFNAVRLGSMWCGLEPQRDHYNDTYLSILTEIVKVLKSHGMYTLLDAHQDVFSSAENVCPEGYDGIPKWVSDNFDPPKHPYPWPFKKISDANWALRYLTQSVSSAFEQFYKNKDGVLDQFGKFWKKLASHFKDENSILGYELLNEPWAGDIYKHPKLLLPGIAGKDNLLPVYDFLWKEISEVDKITTIFYEPVTWGVYSSKVNLGTGFDRLPGGSSSENRAVLSYHYYCWLLNGKDMSQDYPLYLKEICDRVFGSRIFPEVLKDVEKTKGSLFLTEFGLCGPDNSSTSINTIECQFILSKADEYLQSWTYWDSVFFDDDGNVKKILVESFARPYAQATSGIPQSMKFDLGSKSFTFSYINDPSINAPTEIFVPKMHYPHGIQLSISPTDVDHHYLEEDSILYVKGGSNDRVINVAFKPAE